MTDYKQIPPHSAETENMVLSSMLFDEYGLLHGVTELAAEMFYRPDNRIVFEAMSSLYISNKPVDVVTLSEKLKETGMYDKIGGLKRISDIASETYTSAHIKHHAAKLKEYFNRRKSIQYAQEVMNVAYGGGIEELTDKLSNIPSFEQAVQDKSTGVLMQEAASRVQDRYNEPDKKRIGLLTGLKELDYNIGGLKKEDVIFLTAEPNVGKSLLALQICVKIALEGRAAVYCNFEMNEDYIGDRILAMSLPLEAKAIHTPRAFLTQEGLDLINNTDIDKRLNDTLFIYTNVPPRLQTVITKCRQLRVKGTPPAIIIVDYLQLMDGDGKNQMERVENISKGLKRIAKEFNCPVLVISSLSKDNEMRHSYQLRFDADVVLFMSTDKALYEKRGKDCDIKPVKIEVQKNRNGRVGGVVDLSLSLKYLSFRDAKDEDKH